MGFASVRVAVEDHIQAEWSTTPIQLENYAFRPPDGPYLRCVVREGASQQVDLHDQSPRIRNTGTIILSVFVKAGTGTATARTHIDALVPIFERKTISGVHFLSRGEPLRDLKVLGERDGWWGLQLTIPFYWDDFGA